MEGASEEWQLETVTCQTATPLCIGCWACREQ